MNDPRDILNRAVRDSRTPGQHYDGRGYTLGTYNFVTNGMSFQNLFNTTPQDFSDNMDRIHEAANQVNRYMTNYDPADGNFLNYNIRSLLVEGRSLVLRDIFASMNQTDYDNALNRLRGQLDADFQFMNVNDDSGSDFGSDDEDFEAMIEDFHLQRPD